MQAIATYGRGCARGPKSNNKTITCSSKAVRRENNGRGLLVHDIQFRERLIVGGGQSPHLFCHDGVWRPTLIRLQNLTAEPLRTVYMPNHESPKDGLSRRKLPSRPADPTILTRQQKVTCSPSRRRTRHRSRLSCARGIRIDDVFGMRQSDTNS